VGGRTDSFTDLESMSGIDFERAITALLEHMGFHAQMTKATDDGGIDIVATLDRPVVGGKYLVQSGTLRDV
jgi:HJR/Mrr/RecB family endonuclease